MDAELTRKLGIKSGQTVCLLGASPDSLAKLKESFPEDVALLEELGPQRCDLLLFWPRQLPGLAERFRQLQDRIHPDGAIWAVIPKKKFALARGMELNWEQLQAAGLQSDLVDNKVASISEQEYATRFVIRKERRGKYRQLEDTYP
jgi:hypothetical protein